MWKILCICALVSLTRPTEGSLINSFAGPFDIVFHKLERCPGQVTQQKIVDIDPLHPTKDPHNKYGYWYSGLVALLEDFTDDVYAEWNVASWSAAKGGWMPNAYTFSADRLCSLGKYGMQYIPEEIIQNATASAGMTPNDIVCPFPKGNYTIKDLYINLDISHLVPPVVPYGKWRVQVMAARNRSSPMEACVRCYADILPKPGGKSGKFPTHFNMSALSSVNHGGTHPSMLPI